MNIKEENRRKVHTLAQHLYNQMKEAEEREEYERCQELKDYVDTLGFYLTAYSDYEDVSQLIYWLVKSEGKILILSREMGAHYATFDHAGETWSFIVTKEEYEHLVEIEEQQNEIRK